MHKGFNSKILFFVLVSIFLAFFVGSLFSIDSNSKDLNPATPILASLEKEKIIPLRIKIPSIGVDAPIKPVGLTRQNSMEAPDKPMETAWFKLGASPGQKGSSVIAGHRGWRVGPAIFDNLYKIKIDDKVYVEDEHGETRAFVVRKMQVYEANELVPEVWNKIDAAYLNLITCSGKWNILTGTSDKRLVVFTELVI